MSAISILNPFHVIERMRFYGPGRSFRDIVCKRMGLPLRYGDRIVAAAKIAVSPLAYLHRRAWARRVASSVGDYIKIPENEGHVFLKPGELPHAESIISTCQTIYRDVKESGAPLDFSANNLFATDLKTRTTYPVDLGAVDGLLECALSDEMIAMVSEYLGEVPILASAQLYISRPGMTKRIGNSLFHRDRGDSRQVKIFVAINEIDGEAGPFTFIPPGPSAVIEKTLRPEAKRLSDEDVFAVVPKSEQLEFTGPPGSAVILDTSRCFHFGSRCKSKDRVVLLLQYLSRFAPGEPQTYFWDVRYDQDGYRNDEVKHLVMETCRMPAHGGMR